MFKRARNTVNVLEASWNVLKDDAQLILFPLFSTISLVLVIASFASSYWFAPEFWQSFKAPRDMHNFQQGHNLTYYAVLFAFYFCNYFIITFFNSGLVFCAIRRFNGQSATFKDGFNEACKHLHQILGWALISASIGVVLRSLEDRSKIIDGIIAAILGIAFSLMSYLVVPIMVAENLSPVAALKESSSLLKKTWGEQIMGNWTLGIIFVFLLIFPSFILAGLGFVAFKTSVVAGILLIVAAVIYFALLMLMQSTLSVIFQTGLYIYAKTGNAPAGFDKETMQAAFAPKK